MRVRKIPWIIVGTVLLLFGGVMVAVFVPLVTLGILGGANTNNKNLNDVNTYLGSPNGSSSRIAVRFFDNASITNREDLQRAFAFLDYSHVNLTSSKIQLIDFLTEDDLQIGVGRLLKKHKQDLDFIVREFNHTITDKYVQQYVIPNDPFYLNSSQAYLDIINASYAWSQSTGSSATFSMTPKEIVVAVIDTGVDMTHPDLAGRLWINPGEIPGNGIDDDGNGYIDDVNGYDFEGRCEIYNQYLKDCTACAGQPADSASVTHFHGTHVAGIIGANQNNGIGISGVAPNVKLMVLKVSDCTNAGRLTSTAIFKAFDYAFKMGADLVSCSFGNEYPVRYYPIGMAPDYRERNTRAYEAAMRPLSDAGILIMASSGNEDIDMDNLKAKGYDYAPCLVDLPTVLCIGAITNDNTKWEYSNYGAAVHVGSPGQSVYSTYSDGSYTALNGTSMATPFVSGEVALLLQASGGAVRGIELRDLLLRTSDYYPSLPFQTRSRINVGRAMTQMLLSDNSTLLYATVTGDDGGGVDRALEGWDVIYHVAMGNQYDNSITGDVLGYGVIRSDFELGFLLEQTAVPAVVRLLSRQLLGVAGLWRFAVIVRDSPGTSAYAYVDSFPVDSYSQTFMCLSAGWVDIEVRLSHPTPWGSYVVELISEVTGETPDGGAMRPIVPSVEDSQMVVRADLSNKWVFECDDDYVLLSSLGDVASLSFETGSASAHVKLNGNYSINVICLQGSCVSFVGTQVVDSSDCIPFVDTDRITIWFKTIPIYLSVLYTECGSGSGSGWVPLDASLVYQWRYWEVLSGSVASALGHRCDRISTLECECDEWISSSAKGEDDGGVYTYRRARHAVATDSGECEDSLNATLLPIAGLADQNGFALFDKVQIVDSGTFGSYAYTPSHGCTACDPVKGLSKTTLEFPPNCFDFDSGEEALITVDGYYYVTNTDPFVIDGVIRECLPGTDLIYVGDNRINVIRGITQITAPMFSQVPVKIQCVSASNSNTSMSTSTSISNYYDIYSKHRHLLMAWDASLFGRPQGVAC